MGNYVRVAETQATLSEAVTVVNPTHRLLSRSFLGLPHGVLSINHEKEPF